MHTIYITILVGLRVSDHRVHPQLIFHNSNTGASHLAYRLSYYKPNCHCSVTSKRWFTHTHIA